MTDDIVKRLRIQAGVMEMGERIAWGSDTALMREAAHVIEALRKKQSVPECWKLVPVEPTEEMIYAGVNVSDFPVASIYCAMIDAAPKPEETKHED